MAESSSKSEQGTKTRAGRFRRGPKHAPRVPFAVLVTGLIVGGMALLLVLNTASAANELRRRDLVLKDADVAAQVQQLRIEVAASAAPARLAAAAAGLGMVPANNPAFLVLAVDGAVRVLGKPGPATAAPIAALHKKKKKKPTPTTSSSAHSPSGTSTSSTSAGHPGTTTSTKTGSSTPSSARPSPSPTPTPTPTVTLPGGDR